MEKQEVRSDNIGNYFLGVDVGSISTNLVVINDEHEVISKVYIRTEGKPIESVQRGVRLLRKKLGEDLSVRGAGATGSARQLTGMLIGADIVKNEITAHALAALDFDPYIRTVIEIGGQDSKIIIIKDGVAVDFAMNTVCAAGTGSFLDEQARRLKIPIDEFGDLALQSENPVSIAGRCTVFAESDMIHKQQLGHPIFDIVRGLCQAMARNYLNNVGKGKDILIPVMFQGGVAANKGMRQALQEALNIELRIPEHFDVMGAIGSAILAQEEIIRNPRDSSFYGWSIPDLHFDTKGFECKDCSNRCEIVEIWKDEQLIARWGSRCGKWDDLQVKRNRAVSLCK